MKISVSGVAQRAKAWWTDRSRKSRQLPWQISSKFVQRLMFFETRYPVRTRLMLAAVRWLWQALSTLTSLTVVSIAILVFVALPVTAIVLDFHEQVGAKKEAMLGDLHPLKIERHQLDSAKGTIQKNESTALSNSEAGRIKPSPFLPESANAFELAAIFAVVGSTIFFLIFGPVAKAEALRRKDRPAFRLALREWSSLLGKRLKTARELKRFENQARFYASALHVDPRNLSALQRRHERYCQKLGQKSGYEEPPPPLDDKIIVGLTAWLYCGGDVEILRSNDTRNIIKSSARLDAELALALSEYISQHGTNAFCSALNTLAGLYWKAPI